ncbi:MAG: hypothetical protein AB4368_05470 [Xenococcaceae cyanobacterium]
MNEKEAIFIVYMSVLNAMLATYLTENGLLEELADSFEVVEKFCKEKTSIELQDLAKERIATFPLFNECQHPRLQA